MGAPLSMRQHGTASQIALHTAIAVAAAVEPLWCLAMTGGGGAAEAAEKQQKQSSARWASCFLPWLPSPNAASFLIRSAISVVLMSLCLGRAGAELRYAHADAIRS